MTSFRDLSIRRKLALLIVVTSAIALVLSSIALVVFESIDLRREALSQISTTASVLGANTTAALTFQDRRAAEETLSALRADARIASAAIYGKDGSIFARYRRNASQPSAPSKAPPSGHSFQTSYLELSQTIVLDGEAIGAIFLNCEMSDAVAQMRRQVGVV